LLLLNKYDSTFIAELRITERAALSAAMQRRRPLYVDQSGNTKYSTILKFTISQKAYTTQ
jgi:hypothetical protein